MKSIKIILFTLFVFFSLENKLLAEIRYVDFKYVLNLIKTNDIISDCYKKAEYFINLASNSLSVFEETEEKNILKNLTSFSIRRNF